MGGLWQSAKRLGVCVPSLMLSLAGAATSIICVATKQVFCRNRRNFVATKVTYFVATNICTNKRNFVETNVLSRYAVFVATKHVFCLDKNMLVASRHKNILLSHLCLAILS